MGCTGAESSVIAPIFTPLFIFSFFLFIWVNRWYNISLETMKHILGTIESAVAQTLSGVSPIVAVWTDGVVACMQRQRHMRRQRHPIQPATQHRPPTQHRPHTQH